MKKAKKVALKAWEKLSGTDQDAAVAGVAVMEQTKSWRGGFVPHPTTYLNQRRWEDEVAAVELPVVAEERPVQAPRKMEVRRLKVSEVNAYVRNYQRANETRAATVKRLGLDREFTLPVKP
jgi:hypothetical protein